MTVDASYRARGSVQGPVRSRLLMTLAVVALLAWNAQAFAQNDGTPASSDASDEITDAASEQTSGATSEDAPTEDASQRATTERSIQTPAGAPDVTMPGDAQQKPEETVQYEDVVLRGAIGHVPNAEGVCTIQDGSKKTHVTYRDGLPQNKETIHGESHREITDLTWDPERVLLERQKRRTQTRGPQSQGESEWSTDNWFVRDWTWDDLGRPEQMKHSQEGGENTEYTCVWEDRRKGECTYNDGVKARVELTSLGEVKYVRWNHDTRRGEKRSLQGFWMKHLPTRLLRKGKIGSTSEKYNYDDDLKLKRIERRQRLLRGTQTLRWRLKRDRKGNVTEVERRCFGACSGIKSTKIYTIKYEDGFDNTFCGAWWNDGIDPTLEGW